MAERVVDGFKVWAGAFQSGDEQAVPMVETKSLDGTVPARYFNVVTTDVTHSVERAMEIASAVVRAVSSVNEKGVPHPLDFPVR